MRKKDKKSGRKSGDWRSVKRVLIALAAFAAVLVGWNYLRPMMTVDAVTIYDSYIAQTGDVTTTMSFSATISVLYSETLTNSSQATVSKIYVSEDDTVKVGDKIVELSNGEILKASMNGKVNEISVSEGDWLWRSRSLVQICDLSTLQVALTVDEYDVQKVAVGQQCTVSIISLGMDFDTEISHINRISNATGNVAYYSASAELVAPDNVLPGMAATVSIPAEQVMNVTTLPMAALSFHEDGSPYVLIRQTDGSYAQRDVETGLSDGMTTEIKSGINPGDEVWVATGTQSVATPFSLANVYASLVGKTVVINEAESGRGSKGNRSDFGASRGNMASMTDMPQDMGFPEGMSFPEGMATPTDMGDMPPAGMTMKTGGQQESGQSMQTEQGGQGQ